MIESLRAASGATTARHSLSLKCPPAVQAEPFFLIDQRRILRLAGDHDLSNLTHRRSYSARSGFEFG